MSRLMLIGALMVCATAAHARFTVLGGAEAWNDTERPAHGYLQLTYDRADMPGGAWLGVTYHTDTLQLDYAHLKLADGLTVSFMLKGEYAVANLLTDYFRDGQSDSARGFKASYVQAVTRFQARLAPDSYVELEVGDRRWFFSEMDDTTVELPPDTWVFEPRLRYLFWHLEGDAGWTDPHRSFPRLRGYAIGIELGVDVRDDASAWGAQDPTLFQPTDPRNMPTEVILRARQWLKAGWQMTDGARIQVEQQAALGVGEDDLTRSPVGGLNPYVAPIAGVPWAGFHSARFASAQLSGHLHVVGDFEIGPLLSTVVLTDPHRVGDHSDVSGHAGVGALIDGRIGAWQIDVRGGWSPTLSSVSGQAAWNALLSVGWGIN